MQVDDHDFSHIPSASRPSSPDSQLEQLRREAATKREMTEAEVCLLFLLLLLLLLRWPDM